MITSTKIHVPTRRTILVLGDTKRSVDGTVDALRYAGIVTNSTPVTSKRDRAQGLHIATITVETPLDNATITKIRSW